VIRRFPPFLQEGGFLSSAWFELLTLSLLDLFPSSASSFSEILLCIFSTGCLPIILPLLLPVSFAIPKCVSAMRWKVDPVFVRFRAAASWLSPKDPKAPTIVDPTWWSHHFYVWSLVFPDFFFIQGISLFAVRSLVFSDLLAFFNAPISSTFWFISSLLCLFQQTPNLRRSLYARSCQRPSFPSYSFAGVQSQRHPFFFFWLLASPFSTRRSLILIFLFSQSDLLSFFSFCFAVVNLSFRK